MHLMSKPAPNDLTWPALLAHWTAFAQASVALPKGVEGDRWRSAVASIINLQAVTFALRDLDHLAKQEDRAVAIDKAGVLIRQHAAALHELWRGEPLHTELVALIAEAKTAVDGANRAGLEWRVLAESLLAEHPGDVAALVLSSGFEGDLYLPTPGVPLFRGSPAAFCRTPDGSRPSETVVRAVKEFLIDVSRPERIAAMRQVYRQFDFAKGRAVRDLVVPMDETLPAGQPLLVPVVVDGEEVGVTLPPRKGAPVEPVPVVFGTGSGNS